MVKEFELRTNHCGFKHFFGQPALNVRKTKWMEFLGEYDFEIKHIKGKENQVVDELFRNAHEIHIASIIVYMTNLKDKIIAATNSDQQYLKIKETLQQDNLQQKFKDFELKDDGILMYKGKIYVSNSSEMKNKVLREMNNVPYEGHPGY
jgi:hypothetical protein